MALHNLQVGSATPYHLPGTLTRWSLNPRASPTTLWRERVKCLFEGTVGNVVLIAAIKRFVV